MRLIVPVLFFAACASSDAVRAPPGPPSPAASPPTAALPAASTPAALPNEHHHELHLPPVGIAVHVTFEGKGDDVPLPAVPSRDDDTAALLDLWKAVFPGQDPAPLHFDLVGSDGFHPMSRPKCTRLLTGAELAAGRMHIVTHNVTYDGLDLPGCYRVKAVVSIEASR
jgi:hypothetical protein